ncbi:MBL fold metallo-hydrolase [Peribacillus psychrosaccharolyticus]|uniref:MBL fold metallo-hydrolase n=1 Tax=Peribacillus psychrosaccharolyticus TaxID=1407 RepID=A0A974NMK8_PERPY|nr:MBL fold metallo-hydrolase [Peribacillus psychrosaccharolyticus]MEC2056422.1 MBL fold metallo-hydrolase [Peribacillus psychrosaccharolyticus]MED3745442.1 MBL fold metallo-hydrolase [Peribacillus psychrosaccharolyticus]QQT00420.1 MBL fold metallo-hydrolase [Peribacillus psychrosaccharolyticus]
MRRIMLTGIAFLLLCLCGCSSSIAGVDAEKLELAVLKIGKADSMVITVGNKTVLVDSGEEEDGEEILQFLKDSKIDQIDYMIITHFDKDHVGGADILLNHIKVSQVITPDYQSNSNQYQEFTAALADKQLTPITLTDEFSLEAGDADFTIYPPKQVSYKGDNDYSLIVSIKYGKNSFLLAGDAEEIRLQELIEQGNLAHTFLKVPHHGRYNSKSREFFTLVKPKYAVITSSDKNPEEEEVVDALTRLGSTVYTTRQGNIYVSSDGEKIEVKQ